MKRSRLKDLEGVDEANLHATMTAGKRSRRESGDWSNQSLLEALLTEFDSREEQLELEKKWSGDRKTMDYSAAASEHIDYLVATSGLECDEEKKKLVLDQFVDNYQNLNQYTSNKIARDSTMNMRNSDIYCYPAVFGGGVGGFLATLVGLAVYGGGGSKETLPWYIGIGLAAEAVLWGWPLVASPIKQMYHKWENRRDLKALKKNTAGILDRYDKAMAVKAAGEMPIKEQA